jgi:peptidoglycan/LPS O-acetylase OafA/YrhL
MKKSAYLFDFISVLIFVTIGRHTHKDGNTLTGTFTTLWPFAVGLLVGWVVVSRTRRVATARSSGLIIALSAVVVGMVLRVISGQGTALTFVIVASAFLSFCLVGWRVLLSLRK